MDSEADRIRLIVMTDISTLTVGRGEPNDIQSLARLLTCACDLEIEGLIATATKHTGSSNINASCHCGPRWLVWPGTTSCYGAI